MDMLLAWGTEARLNGIRLHRISRDAAVCWSESMLYCLEIRSPAGEEGGYNEAIVCRGSSFSAAKMDRLVYESAVPFFSPALVRSSFWFKGQVKLLLDTVRNCIGPEKYDLQFPSIFISYTEIGHPRIAAGH